MPVVAEAVPGLVEVSLFLFFAGLGDYILVVSTTVSLSSTILISISDLSYIFAKVASIKFLQSP
jgi:hypothetical protein